MFFRGTHCRRGRMDKTLHILLQILLWIYSNTGSPPAPTFTQDTCTLVCLFCVGVANSDPLLSVVFHRAVLATCRTLVFGSSTPLQSLLLSHREHFLALNACFSASSWLPAAHSCRSGQCSAGSARVPPGLTGGRWGEALTGCWGAVPDPSVKCWRRRHWGKLSVGKQSRHVA